MNERSWIGVCFFISLIGALFQICAYFAPLWLYIVKGNFYLAIGLWYVSGCGNNCSSAQNNNFAFSTESNLYYSSAVFSVLRGFETASLIGAILLCIALLILYVGWKSWENMAAVRTASIILSAITWLGLFFGLGIFIGGYHDVLYYSPRVFDRESFPWSAILSVFALLCILLVTIFLMCCTTTPDRVTGIPISGDSKMALTPTLMDFNNGKKYYVPAPYTDDRRMITMNDEKPGIHYGNGHAVGYNNKAYITDFDDDNYKPTGYRPRSVAEPLRVNDEIFTSLGRARQPVNSEPIYSHYVERARPAARSILPPEPSNQERSRYTDELRVGASTAYMYRPYAPERY